MHPCEKIGRPDQAHDHQDDAAGQTQAHGGMYGILGQPPVAAADGVGDHHAGTHRHAGKKSHQTTDDHRAGTHCRVRIFAQEISHEQKIHRIVELLDQAGSQKRQGEQYELPPYGPFRQVLTLLLDRCLHFVYTSFFDQSRYRQIIAHIFWIRNPPGGIKLWGKKSKKSWTTFRSCPIIFCER